MNYYTCTLKSQDITCQQYNSSQYKTHVHVMSCIDSCIVIYNTYRSNHLDVDECSDGTDDSTQKCKFISLTFQPLFYLNEERKVLNESCETFHKRGPPVETVQCVKNFGMGNWMTKYSIFRYPRLKFLESSNVQVSMLIPITTPLFQSDTPI